MRPLLVLPALAVCAALAGCARHGAAPSEDARLAAIYDTEWKWRTEQQPDDEDGVRPISDHLPRVDPATQQMRLKYWEDVQHQLAGIHRDRLSADGKAVLKQLSAEWKSITESLDGIL